MFEEERTRLKKKYKFLRGSIIVVEGNIASGKSTLTERLTDFLNNIGLKTKLYKEPILQSYLDLFLADQPKYAYGFQMSMLLENQCLYSDAENFTKTGGIAVMDRSFLGNRVFALVHFAKGNINEPEMGVYDDVFKRIGNKVPDFVIYLQVDPTINVERCKLRDRTCESRVYDLDYFALLNHYYSQEIGNISPKENVLVFDWNKNLPDKIYSSVLESILNDLRARFISE